MHSSDKEGVGEVSAWLVETFPKAFSRVRKQVKPLQLGIIEDVMDIYERLDVPPFSRKRLRSGLNFYTSSKAYLQAQVEGAWRVNILGQLVEPVSKEQAQYATEKLSARAAERKPVEAKVESKAEEKAEEKPVVIIDSEASN